MVLLIIFLMMYMLVYLYYMLLNFYFDGVIYLLAIILMMALTTLLERKILGGIQSSKGPNKVGIFGLLQPMADALKLMFKETMMPGVANWYLFMMSPLFLFFLSMILWLYMPMNYNKVYMDNSMSLLLMLAMMSLSVFGMMLAGWASNSKYALIGGISAAAQMVSYEVSLGILLLNLMVIVGNLNLTSMVEMQYKNWFIFYYLPQFILFFMMALAETNSVPFDLPEAESELVSGYNVEYSSIMFAFFFLAEYSSMLMMCCLMTLFFFGGWLSLMLIIFKNSWFWFCLKMNFMLFLFMLVSGTLPSYSYDQLMMLGWKMILPMALTFFFFNNIILILC